MLERPSTVVTFTDLKLAIKLGSEEISVMITRDLSRRKNPTTSDSEESEKSESESEE